MKRRHILQSASLSSLALASPWLAPTAAAKPSQAARASKAKGKAPPSPYASREDVLRFADELAANHGLQARALRKALAQARPQPAVRQLIVPPPTGTVRNWGSYRDRLVDAARVRAGLGFWQQAQPWLDKAQAQWGVPPQMVVAIVGIETYYGRYTGNFKVIEALATLAFDFPPGRKDRSAFFRNELAEFFLWCQREGRDPLVPMGSFAGAMGLPQFMPSSLNRYAVDFDGSGRIDLAQSLPDVVGSVAHYFAVHGWKAGQPTHFAVQPPSDAAAFAKLREPDIKPTFSAAQMAEAGAALELAGQQHEGPLALVELLNGEQAPPTYFAGTDNFYVVTRYNWSAYYAMAVIGLAQALQSARG